MTLSEYRALKGWTLAEMAERLECTPPTVWRLERNKQRPSYDLLMRIHEVTGGAVDPKTLGLAAA